jgi:putative membrane protein
VSEQLTEEDAMPFCAWSAFGGQAWMNAWPFLVLWFAFKVAMWAVVVTAVVVGVRWLRHHGSFGTTPTPPLEILRARYARGELTRQDFESMRRDLDA